MGGASFRSYGHEAFWFDQAERHYRMDMRTREVTTFDALTNTEKLRIALFEASFRVPGEAGHKLLELLSTTNLTITASVLAIWVGSHATPLGWVVDITMVGVGLIAIGAEAAEVAQELCLFANGIIDASDEMQCRMAASHLARAVAIIGVDVVLAILLKKAVFTMKSRFKAPEAAPVPELPAQQRATPSQALGQGGVPPVAQKGGSGAIPSNINATVVPQSATGIKWGGGIKDQGLPFEDYLVGKMPAGSRLPANFKTIDFYDAATQTATSAKTLDTMTNPKLANPGQVYSSLKGNLDALVNFDGASLSGRRVTAGQIAVRELQVAVPAGTTSAQWTQMALCCFVWNLRRRAFYGRYRCG